jgi:hypothetical protein
VQRYASYRQRRSQLKMSVLAKSAELEGANELAQNALP